MNRTTRNALAIAGMAGGLFFLGQAAASADTGGNQTVTPTAEANNLSLGSGGGAAAGNDTTAVNIAAQVKATELSSSADTGGSVYLDQDSSDNDLRCFAAVCNVTATTGNSADIKVATGDINKSANISGDAVKNAAGGDGNVTANQTVAPTAKANNASLDLGGLLPSSKDTLLGTQGVGGSGAGAGNDTTAINAALDLALTEVSSNANTGPVIDVDQTSGDNHITCIAAVCNINANTGNTANITVETGDINDSANIGAYHDGYEHGYRDGYHAKRAYEADCPENRKPAVAPAPVKRAVAPAAHKTVATKSAAQPKGQLAYTGAETSAPLTLGLIALGAGGALTLAGRRRSSTAAA